MKKVNLFLLAVALGAVVLARASVAEAAVYCGCQGKVVYLSSYGTTSGSSMSYGYIYVQPEHSVMPSYYCYAYVTPATMPVFMDQLGTAASGQDTVYVSGYDSSSATTCPTGSARYLGTLYGVSLMPRY